MKMRKFFALTAAAAIVAALGFSAEAAEAADRPLTGDKKALVVYFSKTGNTQGVAETVAKLTGAEIFRLETVEPYPDDYHTSTEVAKRQLEENARPALKAVPQNLARYDVIFLGHPVWWHTIPTPVMTFLEGARSSPVKRSSHSARTAAEARTRARRRYGSSLRARMCSTIKSSTAARRRTK